MDKGVNNQFVSLVIHSRERAIKLKEILEFHQIKVELESIELKDIPLNSAPVRVMVPIDSLLPSLKILESGDLSAFPFAMIKMTGMSKNLLIPVDFSPASILAVKIGFYLANKFGIEPLILHSYVAPIFNPADPYSDSVDDFDDNIDNIDIDNHLKSIAAKQFSDFKNKISSCIKNGEIPDIKYSTTLLEGIPEQVIHEYCRQNNPALIVMATRDINKKESDLIGSVTAEVIDSCRVPVLTIPDNYTTVGVDKIKHIILFCTLSGFDIVTLRWMMKAFDYPSCHIHLVPAIDRSLSDTDRRLEQLESVFSKTYPTATFSIGKINKSKFEEVVRQLIDENNIQLIIVPNKKSSALSRLFKPTLAHRILFERDIPLLVLPY